VFFGPSGRLRCQGIGFTGESNEQPSTLGPSSTNNVEAWAASVLEATRNKAFLAPGSTKAERRTSNGQSLVRIQGMSIKGGRTWSSWFFEYTIPS
jgi:hypothetical protein